MKLLLGSYANSIALVDWDSNTGSKLCALPSNPDPSWLAWDAATQLLFAVEESPSAGQLHSYSLDPVAVQLQRRDSIPTGGKYPCHILLLPAQQQLWVSNYMGGPLQQLSYDSQGRLRLQRSVAHQLTAAQAARVGLVPERQEMSHPHSAILSPDNKGVYTADLGYDLIVYHSFSVAPEQPSVVTQLTAGYGPRHMCWDAAGEILFVLCELAPVLLSFRFAKDHSLQLLDECPITLGAQRSQCSELCRHPRLPYLYAANRKAGCISQLRYQQDGKLALQAEVALMSINPRHMALSPSGSHLFVALQDSGQVQCFEVSAADGSLRAMGQDTSIAFPGVSYLGWIEL